MIIHWPESQQCFECKFGHPLLDLPHACACEKEGCVFEKKEEGEDE